MLLIPEVGSTGTAVLF